MTRDDRRDPETYAVLGAAMEVHRTLGAGFHEPVYQDAMALELGDRGIVHAREPQLTIRYKGRLLRATYRPDFICFDAVLVELKALTSLTSADTAQVLNYRKASRLERALLINLGRPSLEYRRLVLSSSHRSADQDDGPQLTPISQMAPRHGALLARLQNSNEELWERPRDAPPRQEPSA
jgi:GxxExxY protein